MNRPRVELLRYDLQPGPGIAFRDPPAVEFNPPGFSGELYDGVLTVRPAGEYSTAKEARGALEPHLEAWRMHAQLAQGIDVEFRFRDAETVDLEPEERVFEETMHEFLEGRDVVIAEEVRRSYPTTPEGLEFTPDVRTLWDRYRGFRRGEERLLAFAGFVVSMMDHRYGPSRREAAEELRIDYEVREKMGDFGSREEARKAPPRGEEFREIPREERKWLKAAVRAVILQTARHAAGGDFPRLTMGDVDEKAGG